VLRILGRNLRGESTRVRVGSSMFAPVSVRPDEIAAAIPPDLEAGVHTLQIVHDLLLPVGPGDPPVPHRGFESNLVPIVVTPRITPPAPPTAAAGATFTIPVTPRVRPGQSAVLLVGDHSLVAAPLASDGPPAASLSFTLPTGTRRIPANDYVLRLRVAGAESRVAVDAAGAITGPSMAVT